MSGTENSADRFDASQLRALQLELASLGRVARQYPLEYAIGSLHLLFESRQDIELIVENLTDEISDAGKPI